MITKRLFGVFIVLLLLSSFVTADTPGGISSEDLENDSVVQGVRRLQNATEGFGDKERWEYLAEEWKATLLKSEKIAAINSFLEKLSPVFFLLFGQGYELSLILLMVIVLWIFFFSTFSRGLEVKFSKGVSIVMGLALTLILAHLKVLNLLATTLFKIVFFKDGIWGWIALFIFFVVLFLLIRYLRLIIWKIGRWFKKTREEKEKWDEKFERELMKRRMKSMEKAFSTVEEGFNS